jgi:hypothetical protein
LDPVISCFSRSDDPLLAADALLVLSFWQDMSQARQPAAFLDFEAAVHAQLRRQGLRLAGCDEATLNRYVPERGIWTTIAERVDADARWRTLIALRREYPARWNPEAGCFEGGAAVP